MVVSFSSGLKKEPASDGESSKKENKQVCQPDVNGNGGVNFNVSSFAAVTV
jgi:hypothetical protein